MNIEISYAPFEELAKQLLQDGYTKEAEKINYLMNDVAWTTGSELIGELGQEIKNLRQRYSTELTSETIHIIESAMSMVKRVWPDFPE